MKCNYSILKKHLLLRLVNLLSLMGTVAAFVGLTVIPMSGFGGTPMLSLTIVNNTDQNLYFKQVASHYCWKSNKTFDKKNFFTITPNGSYLGYVWVSNSCGHSGSGVSDDPGVAYEIYTVTDGKNSSNSVGSLNISLLEKGRGFSPSGGVSSQFSGAISAPVSCDQQACTITINVTKGCLTCMEE